MKATWEEWMKYLSEFFYYMVGIALDVSKDKNWKGALFAWCFILAFIIVGVLIAKTLIQPFL